MKKKMIAFLLAAAMLIGMMPMFEVETKAAETVTATSIQKKMENLRIKLCTNGTKYWNYYNRKQWDTKRDEVVSNLKAIVDNGILDKANATDAELGVTTSACSGSKFDSGCRSNYFYIYVKKRI